MSNALSDCETLSNPGVTVYIMAADEHRDDDRLSEEFRAAWARAQHETEMNTRVAAERPTGMSLGRLLGSHIDVVEALVEGRRIEAFQEH